MAIRPQNPRVGDDKNESDMREDSDSNTPRPAEKTLAFVVSGLGAASLLMASWLFYFVSSGAEKFQSDIEQLRGGIASVPDQARRLEKLEQACEKLRDKGSLLSERAAIRIDNLERRVDADERRIEAASSDCEEKVKKLLGNSK